jgi:alpha-N-arabinofuranosidase
MFNSYRGDEVISSSPGVAPNLFTSVTRESGSRNVYIKAVNASAGPRTVKIELTGVSNVNPDGKVIELSGKLEDKNSIREPTKIVPVVHALSNASAAFSHTFAPYSVTVLVLHLH